MPFLREPKMIKMRTSYFAVLASSLILLHEGSLTEVFFQLLTPIEANIKEILSGHGNAQHRTLKCVYIFRDLRGISMVIDTFSCQSIVVRVLSGSLLCKIVDFPLENVMIKRQISLYKSLFLRAKNLKSWIHFLLSYTKSHHTVKRMTFHFSVKIENSSDDTVLNLKYCCSKNHLFWEFSSHGQTTDSSL